MKKILLLTALCFGLGSVQLGNAQALIPTNNADTVVNAGSVSLIQKLSLGYNTLAFQAVITKISGTVAGTAIIYGSVDGVRYQYIPGTDTLTLTNVASQNYIWTFAEGKGTPYLYYAVIITGSGTMAARCTGYVMPKK